MFYTRFGTFQLFHLSDSSGDFMQFRILAAQLPVICQWLQAVHATGKN